MVDHGRCHFLSCGDDLVEMWLQDSDWKKNSPYMIIPRGIVFDVVFDVVFDML